MNLIHHSLRELDEHEELHHHHEVDVGSASHGCVVGVDALDDGCECVPVDMWLYFGESVA